MINLFGIFKKKEKEAAPSLPAKPFKTSANGIELIKKHEGLRLRAYKCPAGVWTIGYGHTGNVTSGMRVNKESAEILLREDLVKAERAVTELVSVPLNQNQFDALVSFVFNVGRGAFERSTLLKLLNAGDYNGAREQFKRWNKGGGKELIGLTNRRRDEAALFA